MHVAQEYFLSLMRTIAARCQRARGERGVGLCLDGEEHSGGPRESERLLMASGYLSSEL